MSITMLHRNTTIQKGDPTLDANRYRDELAAAVHLAETFHDNRFLDAYNYATQGTISLER